RRPCTSRRPAWGLSQCPGGGPEPRPDRELVRYRYGTEREWDQTARHRGQGWVRHPDRGGSGLLRDPAARNHSTAAGRQPAAPKHDRAQQPSERIRRGSRHASVRYPDGLLFPERYPAPPPCYPATIGTLAPGSPELRGRPAGPQTAL